MTMVYLNNAATSYPKPQSVVKTITEVLEAMPASALRSSLTAGDDILALLRKDLATLLHVSHPDRIVLTSGATDALNRLIGGLTFSHALATTDNHNSVLRPLENRDNPGHLEYIESIDYIDHPDNPSHQIDGQSLLVLPHCSNVTGTIHDIASICQKAHQHHLLVMLDASQSAGCIPIHAEKWGVDIIAFTGHKALFGPQGTGGFYFRPGIDLRPTMFGGTGRDSSIIRYDDGDWEYEVGTSNIPGLAGLKAGVEYVLQVGVETIFRQLQSQTQWLITQLKGIPKVRLYIHDNHGGESQGPVVSFNIEGLKPADVGYILQNAYGITTRTGLHCAPLIHQQLGTAPWGTVRVSLSYHTTQDDLQALVDAVHHICQSL